MHRSKARWLSLLATTLLALTLISGCQPETRHQQRFFQFGTLIDITLLSRDATLARQTFSRIETLLKQRQRQWHGWEDGALKRFNEALSRQQAVPVPQILRQLIDDSKKYYRLSAGRFNPALGKLIAAWGFHQNLQPDEKLIQRILQNMPDMDDLIIDNNQARSLNPYLQLDFGAIAKGLAVRQIAALIRQQGIERFIINAGGDIYGRRNTRDKAWRIAIENPFFRDDNEQTVIAKINLAPAESIFTSGSYRRFAIDENGRKRHHIIDPMTGQPSRRISLVTVLTADPVLADVAATTLMMTAIDDLAHSAHKLGIKDFLVITDQHQGYLSDSMNRRIEWIENSRITPHIVKQITGEQDDKLAE